MSAAKKDNEITSALLKTWSNKELATALIFCAMATGDLQAARVCKEAAERLSSEAKR
jgi:electron transfer flavoprotein alpha/beta subunit